MGSKRNLCFVICWVAYVLSAAIYIFSRGFLLSRDTLPTVNRCNQLSSCTAAVNDSCLHADFVWDALRQNPERLADICLPAKSRVILFVVDALRYDFGVYAPDSARPWAHHQNRLPILHELQTSQPNRTLLLRFLADPPTTTLQRLKALTTGSLPTFIDVGSNFATGEISEDNIIDRLIAAGGQTVHMGDSTWTEMFPGRFKRSYPMASFNIYDLDTVDRAVEDLLPVEMQRTDWQLLIAHTLGVDHCGHRYGPTHPEMARKLGDIDRMIRDTVHQMTDDMTLLVVGDHGMTRNGDHGGDSVDETNALMFAYTRAGSAFARDDAVEASMRQIDLVPTLAALLGVAIPYSSLGQVRHGLLPVDRRSDGAVRHEYMAFALQNVRQMRRYQAAMTEHSEHMFSEAQAATHTHDYRRLIDALRTTVARLPRTTDDVNEHLGATVIRDFYANHMRSYADRMHSEFADVWVKFDSSQMSQGLLFMSTFCLLIFLLVQNVSIERYATTFSTSRCCLLLLSNGALGAIGALFPELCGLHSRSQASLVLSMVGNMVLAAMAVVIDFEHIVGTLRAQPVLRPVGWLVRVIFTFSVTVCFSNSFIVHEQRILGYALLALVTVLMYGVQKTHMQFDMRRRITLLAVWRSVYVRLLLLTVAAGMLVRASMALFRCREEQGDSCVFTGTSIDSKRVQSSDLVAVAVVAIFIGGVRRLTGRFGTMSGVRPAVWLLRYGTIVLGLVIGVYFVLARARSLGVAGVSALQVDAMAWVAFGTVIAHVVVMCGAPLLVHVHGQIGSVTGLFRQVRDGWNDASNDFCVQIPPTLGLGGAYTAVFLALELNVGGLVALVLGAHAASGVAVVVALALLVLVLSTVQRFQSGRTVADCLRPDFVSLVSWTLLVHYAFYVTWHQPTLSQIDWHAAFVGRLSMSEGDHNNALAVLLVLLNTFGASLLVVLQYPLLCVFGFAMYANYAGLRPNALQQTIVRSIGNWRMAGENALVNHELTQQHAFELSRGDLNLFEHEHILFGNLFRTGMLLIVLQGVRVFACMLACTIHCRHLMVWKIFAPRFIYEGLISYAMFLTIPLGYLIAVRIHSSVGVLLHKISLDNTVFDRWEKHKQDAMTPRSGRIISAEEIYLSAKLAQKTHSD